MPDLEVLGLTAPVQTGKIQLTEVFEDLGFTFIDLNDAIYDARAIGSSEYNRLQKLMPGCLDPKGVETGLFYKQIIPEFYQELLAGYIPLVRQAAINACRDRTGPIVLSWEYLYKIVDSLPLDAMFLFHSKKDVWYKRMQSRAGELSNGMWVPELVWLDSLIETIDLNPNSLEKRTLDSIGSLKLIKVDVSAADWGEQNLRKLLHLRT